jgi:hypothetical protein
MLYEEVVFPSSNEFGIPDLLPHKIAKFVPLPFTRWNAGKRSHRLRGVAHYYTDDARFTGLLKNPDAVKETGFSCFVEPNFSTNDTQPLTLVLQEIYKKRWLARYWQGLGYNIIVDLAIAPRYREYALLGVPYRTQAYGTYYSPKENDLEWLEDDYIQARTHAGRRPDIFIVYGGTKELGEQWTKRGWMWFPKTQRNIFANTESKGKSNVAKPTAD